MSRAFVKEDSGWGDPGKHYSLPRRSEPSYDEATTAARHIVATCLGLGVAATY